MLDKIQSGHFCAFDQMSRQNCVLSKILIAIMIYALNSIVLVN